MLFNTGHFSFIEQQLLYSGDC